MDIQVLKNSETLFNMVEYNQENLTSDYLTIVQESDLQQEVFLTTDDTNMAARTVPINIINIPDDQILKIEFQNGSGIINTEFIMNDNLLATQYIQTDKEIPIVSEETVEDKQESSDEILSAVQSLSKYNDVNLSLPSPETDEDSPSETDLTSLNWLHNITNIMAVPNLPTPPISPPPNSRKCNKHVGQCQEDLTININFYKKNGDKKPPFSYATLICMAMSKNGNKMTLSAIYSWIRENFLYYRKAHPSWQVGRFS